MPNTEVEAKAKRMQFIIVVNSLEWSGMRDDRHSCATFSFLAEKT